MTTNGSLYCGKCGFYLGSGIAGGVADCVKCGQSVIAKSNQRDAQGALGDLVLLGVGLIIGAMVLEALGQLFS